MLASYALKSSSKDLTVSPVMCDVGYTLLLALAYFIMHTCITELNFELIPRNKCTLKYFIDVIL